MVGNAVASRCGAVELKNENMVFLSRALLDSIGHYVGRAVGRYVGRSVVLLEISLFFFIFLRFWNILNVAS